MIIENSTTAMERFEARTGEYTNAAFGRVITAMVTPFNNDDEQSLNLRCARNLASYLSAQGSEGLVLAGTTGESPTLLWSEQMELFEAVKEVAGIPILAGTGSNSTAEVVRATKEVTDNELANGLLVVSPYYNKPSQYGIVEHFKAIADSTDLPIVMYNIPGRTAGMGILNDASVELSGIDNIVGVKDATGDVDNAERIKRHFPEDFMIYSGDDSQNEAFALRAGSVGAISVASHWAGNEIAAMYDAINAGDFDRANKISRILAKSYEFEGSAETPNPHPAKAMMRSMGIDVGYGRKPMVLDPATELDLEKSACTVKGSLEKRFQTLGR
jgi:4-hydroxy-tetrahydrodipicolinate synthase